MNNAVDVPVMGLGVGITPGQIEEVFASRAPAARLVDFVQPYIGDYATVADITSRVPDGVGIVAHGAGLSPISADGVDEEMLDFARAVLQDAGAPWLVEDLAVFRLDGEVPLYRNIYWPPVFDEHTLGLVASRLQHLQAYLGRPFFCELPPLDLHIGTMDACTWFRKLVEKTDARLTLDVSHWLRLAQMTGRHPTEALDEFPLDNVWEVHIAGGIRRDGDRWYDEEHSGPLLEECLELLDHTLGRTPNARAVTLEQHYAPLDILLEGIEQVARLPNVRALRDRKAKHWQLPREAEPAPEHKAALLVDEDGPVSRRQRWMREVIHNPQKLESLLDGTIEMDPADRAVLYPSSQREMDWRLAVRAYLQRYKPYDLAEEVFNHLFDAPGKGRVVQRGLSQLLREGFDHTEAPMEHLIRSDETPSWARDALSFVMDIERIRDGLEPRSDSAEAGDSIFICYSTSPVASLNALRTSRTIPDTGPTEMSFRWEGDNLRVSTVQGRQQHAAHGK